MCVTYIRETSLTKIREELSLYKPFKKNTKVTLYHIISKYSNWFAYDDAKLMANNLDEDNIINIFQGFKYNESKSNDFTQLQPFLNHIKYIVCHDDEDKYDYFMKWWANIFQNHRKRQRNLSISARSKASSHKNEQFKRQKELIKLK